MMARATEKESNSVQLEIFRGYLTIDEFSEPRGDSVLETFVFKKRPPPRCGTSRFCCIYRLQIEEICITIYTCVCGELKEESGVEHREGIVGASGRSPAVSILKGHTRLRQGDENKKSACKRDIHQYRPTYNKLLLLIPGIISTCIQHIDIKL